MNRRPREQVPVFYVAWPLMRKRFPDGPPFRIIEVPASPSHGAEPASAFSSPKEARWTARQCR